MINYFVDTHQVKIKTNFLNNAILLGECQQRDYSAFLEKLNNNPEREAEHVYAMWSDLDEMVIPKTWGKPTARIPGILQYLIKK